MITVQSIVQSAPGLPAPGAVVRLLKPITWFPPMWAFGCGAVASGAPLGDRLPLLAAGALLTGPLVCGASQVVNDWFDREVDAINEPGRPIPSGAVPGRWGLGLALGWSALSAAAGAAMGPRVLAATLLALALAWAYSAPPLRLKRNGWLGNAAVGVSYEGLAWCTGTMLMLGGAPPGPRGLALAGLYSLGAHGIMTLNDFKAVEGDRRTGIGSLPVRLGVDRAARVACAVMLLPQLAVVALLAGPAPGMASGVAALAAAQLPLMARFLAAPRERAAWYSGFGVPLFVLGMLLSALTAPGGLPG